MDNTIGYDGSFLTFSCCSYCEQSGAGWCVDEAVGNDGDLCCHHFGDWQPTSAPWQGYSSEQQQGTDLL